MIKLLSGTALAVLLSISAAPVVMAESMTDARPDWEVQSIQDGQLTVKMKGGEAMQTFTILPETVQSLSLQPGSVIELNHDNVMVGTVASVTQTNIDVDFEDQKRITYPVSESGNDYDLGDKVVVTPDRVLGKVSEWQLSAADITVLDAQTTVSSTSTSSTPAASSSPSPSTSGEAETNEVEAQAEVEPVRGLW